MLSAANIEHGLMVFRRLEQAAPLLPEKRLGMLLDNGLQTLDGVPRTRSLVASLEQDLADLADVDRTVVQSHASKAVTALERAHARLVGDGPLQGARAGANEPRVARPRPEPRPQSASTHRPEPGSTAPPRPTAPPRSGAYGVTEQQLASFESAMKGVDFQGRKAFYDLFVGRGIAIDHGARQVNELRTALRSPKDRELYHAWIHVADRGADPSVAAEQLRDLARTTPPRLTARGTNMALMARWTQQYG